MLTPPPTQLLCASVNFMTVEQISGVGTFGFDYDASWWERNDNGDDYNLNMMKEMFDNVMKMFIILMSWAMTNLLPNYGMSSNSTL